MVSIVVKEKLQNLTNTQESINAVADYFIENGSDAKQIIKLWNEEFTTASVSRKLCLLYVANDVLQRCKSNAFLPPFVHYLPKATAHLYKHGDSKIRAAVMRLVDVWEMRKVLRSHGMAAVKSHLDKVKDTIAPSSPSNGHSESVQGNKRKRDTHPIVDATETVEIVAKQRLETEHAILHLMKERELAQLTKEELMKLHELSERHCTVVKSEIQIRKRMVELLKDTLATQEEGLKKSKEALRLCFVRQEEIKKAASEIETTPNAFEIRRSLSLDPSRETSFIPQDDISLSNPIKYDCPPNNFPSLVSPYPPMDYGGHPPGQPVHALGFSVMPPDHMDKSEHDLNGLYNPAFIQPEFVSERQPPLVPYDPHLLHGLHSPYGNQLNYQGYPGQYDNEPDWRT